MADPVSLANLSDALSLDFEPEIVRTINREAVTARLLPIRIGGGKTCNWDVTTTGALAENYAEAADVASYGADDEIPASLSWALLRAPFRVTGLAQAAAATSQSPAALRDIFAEKMFGAVSHLGSTINSQIWNGDAGAGTPQIHGLRGAQTGGTLGAAIASTGTYAGIARGSVASWAATLNANGGTPRALSFDLMRAVARSIYVASGITPDLIVTDPIQFDKYAALFDTNRRYPISDIRTAAGDIKLQGGERALEFDGIPVVRDKDHPAGSMTFLSTQYVDIQVLPTRPGQDNAGPNGTFQIHDDANRISGIPARIEMLGKTGDTTKAFAKVYIQVRVRRPNACGALVDLS